MSEIVVPEGWELKKIKDVCRLINGRAFKPTDWGTEGLPIIRIQNLNNPARSFNYFNSEVDEKFLIEHGELLFAWSGTPGTSFGAHIWNGGKAILNQHIFRVIPNLKLIDKTFLKYALNNNLDVFISKSHGGAGLRHITKPMFENSDFFLPSLEIQKKIVKKLDYILGQLEEKKKQIISLIKQNNERIKFFEKNWFSFLINNEIENHPNYSSWELVKLNEFAEVIRGSSPRPKGDSRYFGGPIPWIKISDITKSKGKYIFHTKEGLTKEGMLKSRFLKSGTLILTTSMLIAMPKILKMDGCIHDGFLAILNLNDKIDLDFLYYYFLGYRGKIEQANSAGTAIKNINTEIVKNLIIPLPPIQIQRQIVEKIEKMEEKFKEQKIQFENIKQNYESRIKYINHIQFSILNSAFSGKLVR